MKAFRHDDDAPLLSSTKIGEEPIRLAFVHVPLDSIRATPSQLLIRLDKTRRNSWMKKRLGRECEMTAVTIDADCIDDARLWIEWM